MLLARGFARRVPSNILPTYRGPVFRSSFFSQSPQLYPAKAAPGKKTAKTASPKTKLASPASKSKVSSKATIKKATVASKKAVKAKAPAKRGRPKSRPVLVVSKVKLYPPRPKASTTGYALFCTPGMKKSGSLEEGAAYLVAKAAEWQVLPEEEKQVYNDQAADIRVELAKVRKAWLADLSPAALKQFRADARAKIRARMPVDDQGNKVKQAGSEFAWFMKSRAPEVFKETGNIGDMSRAIGREWKAMSYDEKAPFRAIRDEKAAAYRQAMLVAGEQKKLAREAKAADATQ